MSDDDVMTAGRMIRLLGHVPEDTTIYIADTQGEVLVAWWRWEVDEDGGRVVFGA